MKLAIVGTAGSYGYRKKTPPMTKEIFENMLRIARKWIAECGTPIDEIDLISGGSGWSDHVAVILYMESYNIDTTRVPAARSAAAARFRSLKIHLPEGIIEDCATFVARDSNPMNRNDHYSRSPGEMLNSIHRDFGRAIGRNTIKDILDCGANLSVHGGGFKARNRVIARDCTHMLAFSWAPGSAPIDGGTLDVWNKCAPNVSKYHISLADMAAGK
jgi:hypothetical protein